MEVVTPLTPCSSGGECQSFFVVDDKENYISMSTPRSGTVASNLSCTYSGRSSTGRSFVLLTTQGGTEAFADEVLEENQSVMDLLRNCSRDMAPSEQQKLVDHLIGVLSKTNRALSELQKLASTYILLKKDEMKTLEEVHAEYKPLCSLMKTILGGAVDKVIVALDAGDTACTLLDKTLEVNARHPIMVKLKRSVLTVDKTVKEFASLDRTVKDFIWLLYDTALLNSTMVHEDPTALALRITRLMKISMNISDEDVEICNAPHDQCMGMLKLEQNERQLQALRRGNKHLLNVWKKHLSCSCASGHSAIRLAALVSVFNQNLSLIQQTRQNICRCVPKSSDNVFWSTISKIVAKSQRRDSHSLPIFTSPKDVYTFLTDQLRICGCDSLRHQMEHMDTALNLAGESGEPFSCEGWDLHIVAIRELYAQHGECLPALETLREWKLLKKHGERSSEDPTLFVQAQGPNSYWDP